MPLWLLHSPVTGKWKRLAGICLEDRKHSSTLAYRQLQVEGKIQLGGAGTCTIGRGSLLARGFLPPHSQSQTPFSFPHSQEVVRK